MADFLSQRSTLNRTRDEFASGQHEVASLQARIDLLRQEAEALARAASPNNAENHRRQAQIGERIGALERETTVAQERLDRVTERLGEVATEWRAIEMLTDPRVQLPAHFTNRTPFLLFPVRLETRFKTVIDPASGAQRPQLWVRIYPDTCMVDSFEPQLSPQDLRSGARFWAEYYAAGQPADPANPDAVTLALQKAAWAFLVNAVGAGRAAWIVQSEEATPLPGSVFPLRDSAQTVILTVATEDAAILANQAAIFAFFAALWRAGDDAQQRATVIAGFANAEDVIARFLPVNFDDPLPVGVTRTSADVKIALVLLPTALDATGKTQSWSQAARVTIAPERFVLLGYKGDDLVIERLGAPVASPLYVGFNPNATAGDALAHTPGGDLTIPDEVKWVVDFDTAVAQGMGFRIDLTDRTRDGIDRLLCLGVRLGADEGEDENGGRTLVGELFAHHFYSDKGMSIVPQGTPTNNTEEQRSGFAVVDDPDATFDLYFRRQPAYMPTGVWEEKADGQWLAEWLGLDDTLFRTMLHAGRRDQSDAINMNLALWSGTFGYAMESMMAPVFSDATVEATRRFFCHFVSGRGAAPAVRIGSQPYGILPAAAFDRLTWPIPRQEGAHLVVTPTAQTRFVAALYTLLRQIDADWQRLLAPQIRHVAEEKPIDVHQHLLDILGLHPNSVEFYFRYMQSLEMLYSYATLALPFGDAKAGFDKMEFGQTFQLLRDLGYAPEPGDDLPPLSKLYGLAYNWQHKVIVDTPPLSETNPIRSYTADDRNYVVALLDAAATSLDALRTGTGLSETPAALLYKLLKFALEQGYYETAVRLHQQAEIFTDAQVAALRTETPYIHMEWQNRMVESRYALLYKQENRIATGISVADRITNLVRTPAQLQVISPVHHEQLAALARLQDASTARLERALVEHLDCCSYRLDAWEQGVLRMQLMQMRGNQPTQDAGEGGAPAPVVTGGLYVGAFGWLENVRPERDKALTPVTVPAALRDEFPLAYVDDAANGGYIHAPSVNQAVTAAVLRNGFLTNGKNDANSEMAVNLSSERVRLALSTIEGIQNGQPLAALLGYHFERTLHDQVALVNRKIDTYIYALRKRFPLNADKIAETKVANDPSVDPETVPITAVEARNVVHGKRLIDHVRKQTGAKRRYPFGFPASALPAADSVVTQGIDEAVALIMNIEDAVADLAMAESVHQMTLGNYERAAGVLDSYSSGNYPQTPDVIRTPRSGPSLTHRVGLHLEFVPAIAFETLHPRKSAEPSLNGWLAAQLPDPSRIVCHVTYRRRSDGGEERIPVTLQEVNLDPIDLLYLIESTGEAALATIDEHLLHYVYTSRAPMLDERIEIEYIPRPADATKFALFEVIALVRSLRALLLQTARLKPADLLRSGEASTKTEPVITLARSRADDLIAGLDALLNGSFTTNALDLLTPLPETPTPAESESILQNVDAYLTALFAELEKVRRYGIPQSGSGHLYQRRAELIGRLRTAAQMVIARLEGRAQEYADLLALYDPTADDAVAQLQRLEALVSTHYSELAVITLPTVTAKKTLFDAKRTALAATLTPAAVTGIWALLDSLRTVTADLGDFDADPFDLAPIEAEIVRLALNELKPFARTLYDLGMQQIGKATAALADYATSEPAERVDQIERAVQAILGDEFKIAPRYDLATQQAFEIGNAWNDAALLDYLKNVHTPPSLDPAEDWLHGVARVREKMHHAENVLLLREALGLDGSRLALHPIQLPWKTTEYHWLALSFPPGHTIAEGETLLYTALTAAPAPAPASVCGFLIDEWTEVIPADVETTGLTFHYDRPGSEAPQTFLLVLPTTLTGNWQWRDLVDALHNTLDAARLRAMEPHQIDQTTYARYLPALLSPTTRHPITIGMYLAALPDLAVLEP